MKENTTVTARKQNNPAFRIVPFDEEMPGDTVGYLSLADDLMDEYEDVFEALTESGNRKMQKNDSARRQEN